MPPLVAFWWAVFGFATVFVVCLAASSTIPLWAGLLGLAGFLTGASFTAHVLALSFHHASLGWCNVVTLARLALTCLLLAMVLAAPGASWPIFWLAVLTLSLDGVDGWLARREGRVSRFGAGFDMEVDAVFALVLAFHAAIVSPWGVVVILLGMPRYLFALAGPIWPWLRQDLPERFSRKAVCVVQLGVLIALQSPVMPASFALVLIWGATSALIWSFAVDIRYLRRQVA